MNKVRIIAKIGGGVLPNREAFEKAATLAKEKKFDVVVISAAKGITNMLDNACTEAMTSKYTNFEKIKTLHDSIYTDSFTSTMHNNLYVKLKSIADNRSLNDENKASIKCYGEKISAYIFSKLSDFKYLLPENIQIGATGSYLEAVAHGKNFDASLFIGKNCVVPGYYGVDTTRKIKLFGRSGSDYTAAFLAKMLSADEIYFFKEVDGYMTANPKIVPNAKLREEMSYTEVKLLGNSGSEIIHAGAAQLLEDTKIISWIKNFFNPLARGTRITNNKPQGHTGFSIANKESALLSIEDIKMAQAPNYASNVFGLIGKENINIEIIGTAQTALSFTTKREDGQRAFKILQKAGYTQTFLNENTSLISIVGDSFDFSLLLKKTFETMFEGNYTIHLISQAQKNPALSIVVEQEKTNEIINVLHNSLLGAK